MIIIGKNKKQFWQELDLTTGYQDNDAERNSIVGPDEDPYINGELTDGRSPTMWEVVGLEEDRDKSTIPDGELLKLVKDHPALNFITGNAAIQFSLITDPRKQLEFLDKLQNNH